MALNTGHSHSLHNYEKWFAFHGMIPFKIFYFTNKSPEIKPAVLWKVPLAKNVIVRQTCCNGVRGFHL